MIIQCSGAYSAPAAMPAYGMAPVPFSALPQVPVQRTEAPDSAPACADVASLAADFIDYIDVKPTTLTAYRTALKAFASWAKQNCTKAPTRSDIRDYKRWLTSSRLAPGTQGRYLRVLKTFFRWCASSGQYADITSGIRAIKVAADNTHRSAFAAADVRKILASINRTTLTGKRDYALVLLAVTAGTRLCEVQRANVEDLQTAGGIHVLYIQGKGHDAKDDFVKVVPEVYKAIQEYLAARKNVRPCSPLFAGTGNRSAGKRLLVPSLSRWMKRIFARAGYSSPMLTAHSLRHTSNTLLFDCGADLYTVQRHARHTDPKTTEIYIHTKDKLSDACERLIYGAIMDADAAGRAGSLPGGTAEAPAAGAPGLAAGDAISR